MARTFAWSGKQRRIAARISSAILLICSAICLKGAHSHKLESASAELVEKGRGVRTELQQAAKEESFLQQLFGTDCYGQALRELDTDCRRLNEDQRQRLAYHLARCFLKRSTADPPLTPCPPKAPAQQCTSALSDKAFGVYTQFFTNILSVCLFVSNQDYLIQAEQLTLALHGTSTAALNALIQISANISSQQQMLQSLGSGLDSLHASQRHLSTDLQAGLTHLTHLTAQAGHVQAALNTSLGLQAALASRQVLVSQALEELTTQEEARAAAAQLRWKAASEAASALESRQSRYEALQSSLAAASEQLVRGAGRLQGSLDTLGAAQARSEELLGYLRGSSHKGSDLVAYAAAAVVLWLAASLLPPGSQAAGRAAALLLLAGTFAAERWLLGALPALGWHLTPDGQVPFVFALPWPLAYLWPPTRPLVILVDPRWAVRACCATLGLTALLVPWRMRARRQHAAQEDLKVMVQALEHQLQVVAAQQLVILRRMELDMPMPMDYLPGAPQHATMAAPLLKATSHHAHSPGHVLPGSPDSSGRLSQNPWTWQQQEPLRTPNQGHPGTTTTAQGTLPAGGGNPGTTTAQGTPGPPSQGQPGSTTAQGMPTGGGRTAARRGHDLAPASPARVSSTPADQQGTLLHNPLSRTGGATVALHATHVSGSAPEHLQQLVVSSPPSGQQTDQAAAAAANVSLQAGLMIQPVQGRGKRNRGATGTGGDAHGPGDDTPEACPSQPLPRAARSQQAVPATTPGARSHRKRGADEDGDGSGGTGVEQRRGKARRT